VAPYGRELVIRQGVEMGRESVLHARVLAEGQLPRGVEVGGPAVMVAEGAFTI
jgi:trans-2,3-dihydro-3-hydroxyanthranilate isomerase